MPKINVPPLGRCALAADRFMEPIMRFFSAAPEEEPQRTHRWNNRRLSALEVFILDKSEMYAAQADVQANPFRPILFHLPRFGGWRRYVVIAPSLRAQTEQGWHIGWLAPHANGVSRIVLDSPVRVLLGPGEVKFFGVDRGGEQTKVQKIGEGRIGDGSGFGQLPLL